MVGRQNSSSRNTTAADEYLDHGLVSWAIGDSTAAIRFYRRAVRLEPSHALGHYLLGIILNELGRVDEARREFCLVLGTKDRSSQAKWARRQVMKSCKPGASTTKEKGA